MVYVQEVSHSRKADNITPTKLRAGLKLCADATYFARPHKFAVTDCNNITFCRQTKYVWMTVNPCHY